MATTWAESFMVRGLIPGKMTVFIRAIGATAGCTAGVRLFFLTETNTVESGVTTDS